MGQVTKLLQQATEGDQRALDVVLPIIEKELHARAVQMMRAERRDHTLQPTALVHEAYLRLVDKKAIDYADRAHFLAVASKKCGRFSATTPGIDVHASAAEIATESPSPRASFCTPIVSPTLSVSTRPFPVSKSATPAGQNSSS